MGALRPRPRQAATAEDRGEQPDGHRRVVDLLRGAGRVVIWATLVLVLVRGVGQVLAPSTTGDARPSRPGVPVEVSPEARAFAVRFAAAYLDASPRQPIRRARRVQSYFASGLRDETALPSHGPGMRVASATVAREEVLGDSRARITVAVTSTRGTVRYLTVPVAEDDRGGLRVSGRPALVAPPPRGTAPPDRTEELTGPHAREIATLAAQFLTTYLEGGDAATLRYYLAPKAQVAAMPHGLRVQEVETVARDLQARRVPGTVSLVVAVRLRDGASGVTFALAYRLRVTRTDRWYVAAIEGGPHR